MQTANIGNKLIDVKARLEHGNFGGWLDAEFGWSIPSAARFMQVADKFGNIQNYQIDKFGASALYLLAAPSTPEPARIEAIERAQAGEEITYTAAKAIVAQHRPAEPPRRGRLDRLWKAHFSLWCQGMRIFHFFNLAACRHFDMIVDNV